MKKEWKKRIAEVMEYFEFQYVQTAIDAVQWKWADKNGGMYVPDVDDMRKTAKKLMKRAVKDNVNTSSGGFEVEKGEDYILLRFVIEEWCSHDEE